MSVMFVDDDSLFVDIVCHKLQNEGVTCTYAPDGQSALDMLAKDPKPHLIILDVIMPIMDGFEVLKKLKSEPKTAPIPVVLFSNDLTPENIAKGKELGAVKYLEKIATNPSEFTDIVKEIIRSLTSSK